jgi:hypothetical protein
MSRTVPATASRATARGVALALALCLTAAACGGRTVDVPGSGGPVAGAGGCTDAGGGTAILTFRGPDGTCIPADELFGFACDTSALPPMIVRGGASEQGGRRFVGGRYAVEVPSLPDGVRPIGSAGDLQVLAAPGDATALYVRTDGRLERWLALPREPVAAPPSAWFIGDSIALGAQPWIEEALPAWETTFDAEIGRGSGAGVAIAPVAAQALPDVVVVELGSNDASTVVLAANATAILDALRDVPLVVWQNTHGPGETIPPENNAAIATAVAASPNATIADWDRWVDEGVLNVDGVHVQPSHEDEMARLIAPFLTHWLAAMASTAPTSCDRGAL